MTRLARLLVIAPLIACSSTTVRMDFNPSPAQVVVPDESGGPAARALLAVLGAERRTDGELEMLLRVRLENLGTNDLTFECERALLVDADLMTFGPPRCSSPLDGVGAAEGVTVPAGETCLVDLYFPFPPGLGTGDMNLDGLNLRWSVSVGERSELLGTTFARRRRTTVYYPYPDPYFRFQLGYGYRRP